MSMYVRESICLPGLSAAARVAAAGAESAIDSHCPLVGIIWSLFLCIPSDCVQDKWATDSSSLRTDKFPMCIDALPNRQCQKCVSIYNRWFTTPKNSMEERDASDDHTRSSSKRPFLSFQLIPRNSTQ